MIGQLKTYSAVDRTCAKVVLSTDSSPVGEPIASCSLETITPPYIVVSLIYLLV